jgi:ribosomal protein L7/L12
MDPITLMTRYPFWVLAIAAGLYAVIHFAVVRAMRPRGPAGSNPAHRPSRWVIRPAGAPAQPVDLTAFEVTLEAAGDHPIAVIKVVREATGLDLREAKELVESAPVRVRTCAGRDEAEELADAFKREGASVSVSQAGESRSARHAPFEVVLEEAGERPIEAIRLVRELSRRGLKEAKELVESAPQRVSLLSGRDEAERCREKLASLGAWVTLEA